MAGHLPPDVKPGHALTTGVRSQSGNGGNQAEFCVHGERECAPCAGAEAELAVLGYSGEAKDYRARLALHRRLEDQGLGPRVWLRRFLAHAGRRRR